MSRLTDIQHTIDDYRIAELITGALRDLSSTKMLELRARFESNANFFFGVREIYGIIKIHAREMRDIQLNQARSGRDLYLALTSNKRFYGALNRNIAEAFMHATSGVKDADFVMVGATGGQYLEEAAPDLKVTLTEFADDVPTKEEKKMLINAIESHARVFLLYPKFVNPFRQDVAITDITEVPEANADPDSRAAYIFEPEIPRMLEFFEAQARYALLERVLLETELARAAARTIRMHSARDNAHDLRGKYERDLRREYRTLADIAMMETFIGSNALKQ